MMSNFFVHIIYEKQIITAVHCPFLLDTYVMDFVDKLLGVVRSEQLA
jgi:hypothetical protein